MGCDFDASIVFFNAGTESLLSRDSDKTVNKKCLYIAITNLFKNKSQ